MVLDQNKNLKVVIASTINTSVFLLHIVIIAYIDTAVFFEAQNHRRHPQSQQLLSNEDTRRIIKKKKERNKAANNMIIIVAALRILLSYLPASTFYVCTVNILRTDRLVYLVCHLVPFAGV